MLCCTCKINKIGPSVPPYGGYICEEEHMQCVECYVKIKNDKCTVCSKRITFVQMCYTPVAFSLPINQIHVDHVHMTDGAVNQKPTAPSLHLLTDAADFIKKPLFADIETQSCISQEHLTMPDSQESVIQSDNNEIKATDHINMNVENCVHCHKYLGKQNYCTQESVKNSKYANPQDYITLENLDSPERGYCNTARTSSGKECEFLFDNDKDGSDSNVINTSEIRFMDSSDSSKSLSLNSPSQLATQRGCHENCHNYSNALPWRTNNNVGESKKSQKQEDQGHGKAKRKQHDGLCVKMVQNFETMNPALNSELIDYYLKTYGSMAAQYFPICTDQYPRYDQNRNMQMPTNIAVLPIIKMPSKSICVSTNSSPRLSIPDNNNECDQRSAKDEMVLKKKNEPLKSVVSETQYKPNKYVVMPTVILNKPPPGLHKIKTKSLTNSPAITDKIDNTLDARLQKILETIQEEVEVSDEKKKRHSSKNNIIKIPTVPTMSIEEERVKQSQVVHEIETADQRKSEHKVASSVEQQMKSQHFDESSYKYVINVYRARYNPPSTSSHLDNSEGVSQDQPPPQFELIQCSPSMVESVISQRSQTFNMKSTVPSALKISRVPLRCPETNCRRTIFVSDFNKHLVMDHTYVPRERITPFQHKNFFLDPRLSHCGSSKCHLLYLMTDRIKGLGTGKFKDLLPLLVMTTRITLEDISSIKSSKGKGSQKPEAVKEKPKQEADRSKTSNIKKKSPKDIEFLLIWVTGMAPEGCPISYTLTVWANTGTMPNCHMLYSGQIYPIRNSQMGIDVFHEGQSIMLSETEVDILTKGGTELLNLQLTAH